MNKRTNRVISLLLCIVMVCCMLPAVTASASGVEATGLTWGTTFMYNEDGTVSEVAMPGAAYFYGTPNVFYSVEYYQVGQDEYPVASGIVLPQADGRVSDNYLTLELQGSGDYYYVVTPIASDFETPLGNSVTSAPWYYTAPAAKCAVPTNTYWSWPTAYFTLPAMNGGITGVQVEFLFAENANETPESYGWSSWYANHTVDSLDIFDGLVEYCGAGYYYFRARTLSTNLEQTYHSDWSPISGAYYCGTGFMDVDMGTYYAEPVKWAVDRGITTGQDATHFGPDATCTRGQIVTFLWRANGSPEPKSSNNPFYDVSSSDYFYKAVLWAVENGITSGVSANSFAPNDPCTRGQVATFLWRAKGQPSANAANGFYDVAPGAYYYNAVLWAVANGVTNGMGNGSFAPDAPCTRGQIVTFLYRAMA